ncbi:MAG: diacylglycerol kinase family lipid kinase [Oscillospiraceae bacterium]|nr:diacylglycerol kinase family lipid kinase [Oscillospiraceae bacterium]
MSKKLFLVINPKSGAATLGNHLIDILEIFGIWNYEVSIHITRFGGDAEIVIAERASDFDLIVCCGGDGMINEAFSALSSLENAPPLGIIPSGTTNDFAFSLALPTNPIAAANTICTGTEFLCDCGTVNGRVFAYVAAFGLFTNVTYETPQESKNLLGRTAYILEAIRSLPEYAPYEIKLESAEGSFEGEYILGMITNTVSIGGLRTFFSSIAELNDGYLEVTLVKAPKTFADFQKAMAILTKATPLETEITDFLTVVRTKHLSITSKEDISFTLDGEEGGVYQNLVIEVIPHAVSVIIDNEYSIQSESDILLSRRIKRNRRD